LKQLTAKIISNTEIIPGYHLFSLSAPYIAANAQPGQFITVSCGGGLILRRPFSIHRLDGTDRISVLFAIVGAGTERLSKRKKGEKLDILGPLGNGFSVHEDSKKLLLVAGGMGIAPLLYLAQKALKDKKVVKLLLGARTKDHLYPLRLVTDEVKVFVTTEDGSMGDKCRVTDILPKYTDWADQIYACGPLDMYRSMAEQILKWGGTKLVQVSLEVTMGCGIGGCFGCSVKTKQGMKRVCLDGPVFNLDEVILEEVKI
jgi:dihydroorotate dehydrogenase electron transfer subunit